MRRGAAIDLARALDAIYTIERKPDEWLQSVLAALEPGLDQGLGVCGYFVDASRENRFDAWGFIGPPEVRRAWDQWHAAFSDEQKRNSHVQIPYGRQSAVYPVLSEAEIEVTYRATGYRDMLGINALDASGLGVVVAAPSVELLGPLTKRMEEALGLLYRHLGRGARLVLEGRSGPPVTVTYAPPSPLEPALAREALRAVVSRVTLEEPRLSAKVAEARWADLQRRRLVLLDRFEDNGRRYFVATSLTHAARILETLSEREAEVVALAGEGLMNKEIADAAGVSESTVATLLSRAAVKIGATSRVALVNAWRAVQGPDGQP